MSITYDDNNKIIESKKETTVVVRDNNYILRFFDIDAKWSFTPTGFAPLFTFEKKEEMK